MKVITERSEVTSLPGGQHEGAQGIRRRTHKDTSCFQTGFTADMRDPKRPFKPDLGAPPLAAVGEPDRLPLPSLLGFALLTAVRAEMAVEDD